LLILSYYFSPPAVAFDFLKELNADEAQCNQIKPPVLETSIDHCVLCNIQSRSVVCDSLVCRSKLQEFVANLSGNTCQQSTNKTKETKRAHKSAEDMKAFAYKKSIHELVSQSCDKSCPVGGKCFNILISDAALMLLDFWGPYEAEAPKNIERAAKIKKLFSAATLDGEELLFTYKGRRYCERTILGLLGLSVHGTNRVPSQWRNARKNRLDELNYGHIDQNTVVSSKQCVKEFEKAGVRRRQGQRNA